jgi:hypothetical protein
VPVTQLEEVGAEWDILGAASNNFATLVCPMQNRKLGKMVKGRFQV